MNNFIETPSYINGLINSTKYADNSCDFPDRYGEIERESIGFKWSYKKKVQKVSINLGNEYPVQINILNKVYFVPEQLSHIANAIEDSKEMLSYENDWDFEGGLAVNPNLFQQAMEFLIKYSIYIFKAYGVAISVPEIELTRNGNVDFEWDLKSAYMLVNVKRKQENFSSTFYGYYKKNQLVQQGFIDLENIDASRALWMKELK